MTFSPFKNNYLIAKKHKAIKINMAHAQNFRTLKYLAL